MENNAVQQDLLIENNGRNKLIPLLFGIVSFCFIISGVFFFNFSTFTVPSIILSFIFSFVGLLILTKDKTSQFNLSKKDNIKIIFSRILLIPVCVISALLIIYGLALFVSISINGFNR